MMSAANAARPARPGLLCLVGPTAAGKSAVALAIAQRIPCEIISVDSAQVYRGLDLGTAKPSALERALVPHHLIDIRDPTQPYSAAEFVREAQALIPAIQARGRSALLVGGTLLYFKALFDGLDALPAADPLLRANIAERAQRQGWPALHAELAQVDPVSAARLSPHDAQRISRALEVYTLTGQPMSALHTIKNVALHEDSTSARGQFSSQTLISLEPSDRHWLHQRIAQRLQAMFDAGLVAEVARLRARTDLSAELPALRCVGYRQIWQALDQAQTCGDLNPAERAAALQRCLFATRQLAKRQLTWLRQLPQRQVVACDAADASAQVQALIEGCSAANAGSTA